MKKITAIILTLALVLGASLTLVSCGAPKDKGAEISVYLGEEFYDFDPSEYTVDSNAEALMSLLYDPLFTTDANGKVRPSAAKKYEHNKEERELVIELRESYWSDGKRVTADDFIYAWTKILLEPSNANPAAALFYDIENALAVKNGTASIYDLGARKTGVYQITITYREGADVTRLLTNLSSVATAPLREDIVTASPSSWSKRPANAVFNGAFKLAMIDYDDGILTVARNEGYHQKMTSTKYTKYVNPSILYSTFNAEGAETKISYKDLESKTVFYMTEASLADRKANAANATVSDDLSVYSYVFNTDKPLFAIKEVRQALSMVIDRASIIEAITFGKAADGFIPAAIEGFRSEALISASAAKSEANALLAGVDLSGISKEFSVAINDDPESVAIAEIVKAAWESLDAGFTVNIVKLGTIETQVSQTETLTDSALQVLVTEIANDVADFDVVGLDWQLYSPDPFVALSAFASAFSGNGVNFQTGATRTNISGWADTQYDYYINEAYKATDDDARTSALRKAEAILVDAAPIVPVVFHQNFSFSSADISGVKTDVFGNFVYNKMALKNYRDYLEENN